MAPGFIQIPGLSRETFRDRNENSTGKELDRGGK